MGHLTHSIQQSPVLISSKGSVGWPAFFASDVEIRWIRIDVERKARIAETHPKLLTSGTFRLMSVPMRMAERAEHPQS